MVTIDEVAKLAGVSVATVSRVLNDPSAVKEKNRLSVQNAINTLNYVPNMQGLSLRKKRSGVILALLNTITNEIAASIVDGIADCADQYGIRMILGNTNARPEKEQDFCNMVQKKLADGIILINPINTAEILNEFANSLPMVCCSAQPEDINCPAIVSNDKAATYEAIQYLLKIGCKKIAFLGNGPKDSVTNARKSGFVQAMSEAGFSIPETWYAHADYRFDAGEVASRRLLELTPDLDAVFCVSDSLAFNVIRIFRQLGIRVPEDIKVVGFDDSQYALLSTPPITTIHQDAKGIGQLAMTKLYKQIQGEETGKREIVYVPHTLIVRQSTQT